VGNYCADFDFLKAGLVVIKYTSIGGCYESIVNVWKGVIEGSEGFVSRSRIA